MAERYVMRCPETGYETDFKTRKAAERRLDSLAKEPGLCQEPHIIVKQQWLAGSWEDVPEGDLTSEDNPVTIEP